MAGKTERQSECAKVKQKFQNKENEPSTVRKCVGPTRTDKVTGVRKSIQKKRVGANEKND